MKIKSFLLTAALMCVFAVVGSAQNSDDAISKYFNKYLDDERFTVVYISPKMFQMFDKMKLDLDDKEAQAIKNVVKDLRGLRILVAEDMDVSGLYEEASKTINAKEYETLMTVRNKKEDNVQFLIKDQNGGDIINELLLLVGSDDTFVLMSFIGNIDLNKISELADAFENDRDNDRDSKTKRQ